MNRVSPPQGAQAAIRTIRLLKAFTSEQPELTLAQLSARIGLNKTTAHRLLAALESETLVERSNSRGTYRLGPATVALGLQALSTNNLRARARSLLEKLARVTEETATIEVLMGGDVLILDEVHSERMIRAVGHVGTRWPAHATSTGKAILAATTEEPLVLPGELKKLTDRTLSDPEQLLQELVRIRRQGYSSACDELEYGYSAVAVAVHEQGVVRAAISIGGPTGRFGQQRRTEIGKLLMREIAQFERNA